MECDPLVQNAIQEPSIEASFDNPECVGYPPSPGKPMHYAYSVLSPAPRTQIPRSDDQGFGAVCCQPILLRRVRERLQIDIDAPPGRDPIRFITL